MTKKSEPFNNPFAKLKVASPVAPQPVAPAPARPVRAPAPPPRRPPKEEDEANLFLEAVGEVVPVRVQKDRAPPAEPPRADQLHIPTEEAESLARLAELVSGEGVFDVSDGDERIEGAVQGFDARVMKKLRAGDFSFQAHVDLHGLNRDEAKAALEGFIQKSRIQGFRCVLVVTGRGLHSKDQVPVLKAGVQAWLTRGKLAKQVLAFSSAKASDGGVGAVYVLLRR